VIRLREPWELTETADGTLILRRRFHRPTGVRAGDSVVLAVEGLTAVRRITLNERPLQLVTDASGVLRSEVEAFLSVRNEIAIELAARQPLHGDGPSELRTRVLAAGLVRLEIA
jgi:hypothetical protein